MMETLSKVGLCMPKSECTKEFKEKHNCHVCGRNNAAS
jgi:hypothetical protein